MRKCFFIMGLLTMFCQFLLAQSVEKRPIKADGQTFVSFREATSGLVIAPHTYSQNVSGIIRQFPVFYNKRAKQYFAVIACQNGFVRQKLQMKVLPDRPGWRR